MIHMYTVDELEKISGVTRRTIGDYISKGLLAGPSHRGRGARYSQADADVLRVIPRIRTVLRKEFPSLREVHVFLGQLSPYELHSLARKNNEAAFELEVRTLRVHNSLAAILPQVPPEKLTLALKELTPEQIRGVDTGRYQLGAVIDMASLLSERQEGSPQLQNSVTQEGQLATTKATNGNSRSATNGDSHSSWSVNWLDRNAYMDVNEFAAEVADMSALESITQRLEKIASDTGTDLIRHESDSDSQNSSQVTAAAADRLTDIAERVERLERLLDTK